MDVQLPDGTVIQGVPEGTTKAQIAAKYATHMNGGGGGAGPTNLQRIVASPVGRFVHDAIVQPVEALASLAARSASGLIGPLPADMIDAGIARYQEPAYQAALAANRNTPGYDAARAKADAVQDVAGSGITDQMIAPLAPAMAGIVGGLVGGSMDAANAAADAQAAAIDAYRKNNPVLSTIGGIVGGLLAGPSRTMSSVAKMTPAEQASRYVTGLAAKSGHTPESLVASRATYGNKPVTLAEIIGTPAEIGVGALARREGQTSGLMQSVLEPRAASAPQRILDDFASASGIDPAAARGDIETFIASNKKAAAPLYEEAYRANPNIASPALDRILATPAGRKALADARTKMQNDMSLMGTPDADLMEQAREGGTIIPGGRGVASGMKMRVYDYVKKSLDDQINAAYKAGNNHEGSIIAGLKNRLLNELDATDVTGIAGPNSLVPGGGAYARARATAGDYLRAQENFKLGQADILNDRISAQDFATTYSNLGPSDQAAYLGGSANRLFNLQQAGKLRATAFKSPLIKAKLETVMGPDNANAFIKNMDSEERMAAFARKRMPNAGSPTAEYAEAIRQQDGNMKVLQDGIGVIGDAARIGPLGAMTKYAIGKASDAAAAFATRGMSIPVRDEAGRILLTMPADQFAAQMSSVPAQTGSFNLPRITPNSRVPYGMILTLPQLWQQNP